MRNVKCKFKIAEEVKQKLNEITKQPNKTNMNIYMIYNNNNYGVRMEI